MQDLNGQLVDDGPFGSKQKALMFAAALGVYLGNREPLSDTDVAIRWDIFERNGDHTFIHALAVAETGGLDALSNDADTDDAITIFEEYANAGLKHLENRVLNSPGDTMDELIQLVVSAGRNDGRSSKELEGLSSDNLDILGL